MHGGGGGVTVLANDLITNGTIPFLCMLLAVAISLYTLRKRQAQRTEPPRRGPRARREAAEEARRTQDAGRQLMLELEQFARRMNAELDTKFARLEVVVRDADERLAELRELVEASPAAGATLDQPTAERASAEAAPSAAVADPPALPADDPQVREICERAAAGEPAARIAQQVGLPLGEVELVLNLRQ